MSAFAHVFHGRVFDFRLPTYCFALCLYNQNEEIMNLSHNCSSSKTFQHIYKLVSFHIIYFHNPWLLVQLFFIKYCCYFVLILDILKLIKIGKHWKSLPIVQFFNLKK